MRVLLAGAVDVLHQSHGSMDVQAFAIPVAFGCKASVDNMNGIYSMSCRLLNAYYFDITHFSR